ncbi:hypothetical protein [Actinomadura sp. NEAU-AAG7]|uniref:hypothetical protein n=1 Tax=Actinomadura sp. NEAU-AAG7 TaxID=2839640 RepID=UPI001BE492D0|nr:hypothetical protein [Actinomadura sp. NEAU-AAG7]MBT2212495.1 hypothetical protein [Actinomadura sp. NEAU-AAG7]
MTDGYGFDFAEFIEQPALAELLDRASRKTEGPGPLHGLGQLVENDYRHSGQPKFTGQPESGGAGPGDNDVGMKVVQVSPLAGFFPVFRESREM